MSVLDLTFIDGIVERIGCGGEKTIPLLQAIQEHYRYLPAEALRRLSELTGISPAQIAGVSTFYTQFRHTPAGRHIISICHGTACHVKGADTVRETLMRRLGIKGAADTSADGEFTIQKVACLGCCTLAPVIQIDNVTYGHLTGESIAGVLDDFLQMHKSHLAPAKPARKGDKPTLGEIRVGLGSCCLAKGSGQVRTAMEQAVRDMRLDATVKRVGCVGMCHQTPMVEIVMADGTHHHYARVKPADAPAILQRHFKPGGLARRIGGSVSTALNHLLTDETWAGSQRLSLDEQSPDVQAFLSPQVHLATEFCGRLDPLDLEEYQRHDGFAALRKMFSELSPQQVAEMVTRSGLRGRGGAGFPTGKKWSLVAASPGDTKYVICNGDEGDPGAFMDRMILESYPYRVIEGMIIAAYAAGCHEGVFYIRAEYPLAVQRIDAALEHVRSAGLLGQNILGSGFSLDLRIMEGAGAFVCGEETALIASVEGRRGMPRLRPPYPANRGLWDRPTLVNNVETLAMVPWIIRHGAEAFAAVGGARSKGTKVFALAGKVARGGLIEAPMGISLRQIVEDIGGGIAGGKKFKAVQVGGPSGGCLPAE
ncbi:MAG: proton-conducting membrane transporter, partial [Planctomycetaceae bacterium]